MNVVVVIKNTEYSSTECVRKNWIEHIPSCPAWPMSFSFTIDFKPINWQQDLNDHCAKSPILINFESAIEFSRAYWNVPKEAKSSAAL